MWIERNLRKKLLKAATTRPAVLVTGARQTGKSSLLKKEFPEAEYITFDYLQFVEAAKESPEFFLNQFNNRVILDEIQYVPEIFRELKIKIDKNRQTNGKWIMTGSQQFVLMEKISDSLAGRISILHLETTSAEELRIAGIENLSDFLWKGGYPELWANPQIDCRDFFESYIRTYLERDLRQIIDIKHLIEFHRFLKILATRVGQLINYSSLANDTGVSDITARKWINALQIGGLLYVLPPYFSNIGKRLIKSPKLYFADHGLLSYLLGIENHSDWLKHPLKGNLWENFVFMELIKNKYLRPGYDLFFYRDHNGVEIDFVIEKKGTLLFIEAKSSENFHNLKLNFNKVSPLFQNSFKTKNILALNMKEAGVFSVKDFFYLNPLFTDFPIAD